ncbi:polysaccharide lyase family protein [Granulicella sp. dw_53]|uniref:polysaccharide lyase family protein n=1 Tax=Granulicella sp. dw_53 TaxID=2719792 RepID=UPI001BD56D39|nr:polysaccharide lyase family protein [Granulicella sp. dw_53]
MRTPAIHCARIAVLILVGLLASPANAQANPDVQVLLDGAPAAVGTYSFPFPSGSSGLVLDNGLVRFTFNGKNATSKTMLALSIVANGQELAPLDGQNSFYVDASGGTPSLSCSQVKILRNSADLVEVAFVDTTTATLRPEHHLIMRRGKRGLYGYVIETAASAFSISELRVVTRWNRTLLDHVFNWERGSPDAPGTALNGQQPTYAYLATQTNIQDETWRVDGINNPALPPPDSNSGNLPNGYVYTKYNWSLYHHENPMFGHYGHGYGAWLTPLGGVTDQTLAAFYGVGPNHQDLAVHQDGIVLNYFGANHYGLPSYPLPAGYKRLYGPWYFFVTVGDPVNPQSVLRDAYDVAQEEIAENRAGSDWMNDPLYPTPAQRTTVTGHLQIADGRPADGFWALLSTQNVTDVYTIHEPTYFVKTDANGNFTIPGVPPPWAPGTTNPGSYTLYIFASKGSITDQYKQTGITFSGPTADLGTIAWTPTNRTTFLWQIGKADRMGGEFALATNPADGSNPRAYEKPSQIPGTLTYTVGSSWEPKDWYYAQTNAGTWTINFNLSRLYTGTAFLTVSSSMQQGSAPTVAVNGSSAGITGSLPTNNDSTIARQTDRSGYPRLATLSFPASRLVVGANTITLTRGAGSAAGNGLGWDTFVMEVNEGISPPAAQLAGQVVGITGTSTSNVVTLQINNTGAGDANDVRLDGFTFPQAGASDTPAITGRDPNRFPVPIVNNIPAGGSTTATVQLDFKNVPHSGFNAVIPFSANGGRVRGKVNASVSPVIAGSVNLVTTSTIAKQGDGSYLGTVKITNLGSGTAQNVQLTSAALGAAAGSAVPNMIGNIAPGGGPAVVTVVFPASAGATGAAVLEKFSGSYTGGTFSGTLRWVLP